MLSKARHLAADLRTSCHHVARCLKTHRLRQDVYSFVWLTDSLRVKLYYFMMKLLVLEKAGSLSLKVLEFLFWNSLWTVSVWIPSSICLGTGIRGLMKCLATLLTRWPEPLAGPETRLEDLGWVWGEQVDGMWYFLHSVLWYCCLSDGKGIWAVKKVVVGMFVGWLDWSFALLVAPVVTVSFLAPL